MGRQRTRRSQLKRKVVRPQLAMVKKGTTLPGPSDDDDREELWRDGPAAVYRMRARTGDVFTLKTIRLGAGDRSAAAFDHECAIGTRLLHPHILPVFDYGNASGELYQILPRVDDNLDLRLNRSRTLAISEALRIARAVAVALAHMHKQDLVHCNVKPAAIWFRDNEPMLTDFSLVRRSGELTPESALGTPAYMSPEQPQPGEPIDGRSDVYSLGCVLYAMLTGVPPFAVRTIPELLAAHRTQSLRPIVGLRPEIPRKVGDLVQRAVAKRRTERFQTADALANAIVAA